MPITLAALPPRADIYVYEQTAGPTPPATALYQRTYLIGTSTTGTEGVPTVVSSYDDFLNTFGSSSALSLNNVQAYLANTKRGLFYVPAKAYPLSTATVTNTSAGVKSVTINGTVISYTAQSGDTMAIIIDALVTAINNSTAINTAVEAEYEISSAGANVYTNGKFYIRSLNGATFTLAGSGITFTNVEAPTELQYWDYLRVLSLLVNTQEEEPLGFICCPEAFFNLENQWERTQVGNALESTARALNWEALLDPGHPTLIISPTQAVADAVGYTAVRGHSAYYYPYLKDSDNDYVSPSVMVATIALRRYEVEGIHQPPAGGRYPLNYVGGLAHKLTKPERDLLATNKINPFIWKRGIGYIAYDTYTRSADTNFRHISTRVIMSCLERTIQDTLDASNLLFEAVGSRGIYFLKVKNTIEQVLQRFWDGDALYGVRPEDAYKVLCDASIQTAADLEQGTVYAEVYAVPAGTARQLRVNVFRVQIGKMSEALSTSATA